MDSTTALSYGVALARRRSSDVEHVEQPVDLRVVEPAALVRVEHLHLGQGEVECGERGHDQVGGAARVGAVAGDLVFLQIGVHSMGTIFQQHRRLVSSRNCVVGSAAFFLVIWS